MTQHVILVAFLTSTASVAFAAEQTRSTVELNGTVWKIVVKGNDARVGPFDTWLYKKLDGAYFRDANHAAEIASGCKAADSNSFRNTVYVNLDCAEKVSAN